MNIVTPAGKTIVSVIKSENKQIAVALIKSAVINDAKSFGINTWCNVWTFDQNIDVVDKLLTAGHSYSYIVCDGTYTVVRTDYDIN